MEAIAIIFAKGVLMSINIIKEKVAQSNNSYRYSGFLKAAKDLIEASLAYMFKGYFSPEKDFEISENELKNIYLKSLNYVCDSNDESLRIYEQLKDRFECIYDSIVSDISAAYCGDPATEDYDEIILCYPSFSAISTYRIAHELYVLGVKILPRLMSEYVHKLTGIDIHPGATIGKHFFIDHGTGVVIGETTIIGDNVTMYQNVTLGAKSFPHDDEGNLIKGIKRHPNIEDNVVIYAGATILGDITIGKNSIIGGNV